MVKMLRGEVVPGINVPGNKLQMQTSSLGWEIDDLLVYGEPSTSGEIARLSNDYVGRIETSLPNGASFKRKQLTDDLGITVNTAGVTFVYGNSGTGKSALVRTVLESLSGSSADLLGAVQAGHRDATLEKIRIFNADGWNALRAKYERQDPNQS